MAAEKQFEKKVKKFLKDSGCWSLKYWGGAAYTKSGIPDMLVCCNGYFIGLELKAPKGKPPDLQIYNLREIDKAGGFAILLYPKDFDKFKWFVHELLDDGLPYSERGYNTYQELKSEWQRFESIINNQSKGD